MPVLLGAAAGPVIAGAGAFGRDVGPTPAERAAAIEAAADVSYSTDFRLSCTPATWQALVERPLLLGDLWNAYGYAPAYRVSMRGEQIHVVDPTGLVGDATTLEAGPRRRRYLVRGRLDHWAVPFLNDGWAVFILDTQPGGDGVAGTLTVYVKAGSAVAGFLVRLGRPVLLKHVANRIELNLRDAQRLLDAVEHRPATVRDQVGERRWSRLQEALAPKLRETPDGAAPHREPRDGLGSPVH